MLFKKQNSMLMCALYGVFFCNIYIYFLCSRAKCTQAIMTSKTTQEEEFEVCVITSRRPDNVSYITRNLESLRDENVKMQDITVVDTDGSAGPWLAAFDNIKSPNLLNTRKQSECVDSGEDVASGVPCRVLQSNYDVSMALSVCQNAASKKNKKWILFVEDDVTVCAGAMVKVRHELAQHQNEEVSLVSFSKFSRCFAISVWYSMQMALEIRQWASVKPYDYVMWSNTWTGNSRQIKYATNLFHHIGETSTLAYRNLDGYKKMYGTMRADHCGQALA